MGKQSVHEGTAFTKAQRAEWLNSLDNGEHRAFPLDLTILWPVLKWVAVGLVVWMLLR